MALGPLVTSMRSITDSSTLSESADCRKLSTVRAPFWVSKPRMIMRSWNWTPRPSCTPAMYLVTSKTRLGAKSSIISRVTTEMELGVSIRAVRTRTAEIASAAR